MLVEAEEDPGDDVEFIEDDGGGGDSSGSSSSLSGDGGRDGG